MAGQGVVGDLVVAIASGPELGPGELHQVGAQVVIGKLQLPAAMAPGKHGARLQAEVVNGEVGRFAGDRLAELAAPAGQTLAGQALDQVETPAG